MAKTSWPQPVLRHLKEQRWTLNRAAAEMDIPKYHFISACYGRVSPSPDLRARLPKLLNVPVEMLFSAQMLARPYARNARAEK